MVCTTVLTGWAGKPYHFADLNQRWFKINKFRLSRIKKTFLPTSDGFFASPKKPLAL